MTDHINLLPAAYRRKQILRSRFRQWSMIWLAALAVMGAVGWTQWAKFHADSERLSTLQRVHEPIQELREDADELEQRIHDLRQRETLVLSLSDAHPMLTLVGMFSKAARSCDGQVSIRTLNLERDGRANDGHERILTLDGIATDDASVARFVDALREFDAFQRIELKSTGTARVGNSQDAMDARTYRMECVF